MPHCIIEHSSTIDSEQLMPLVFTGTLDSALFEADDIKLRTLSYEHYSTANKKADFIHVVLKILTGRTAEQKAHLSHLVLEKLNTLAMSHCSITVEVVDIDKGSYAKIVS